MITGIKPYASHTESGTPWLGRVPNHWRVLRLKRVCSGGALYGANVAGSSYATSGVRFVRTTDITEDGQLKDGGVFVPEELVREYLLDDGDVLVSRSGTIGRSFLYCRNSHGPCAYAGYLVRFVPTQVVLPKYIFLFTKTQAFTEFLRVMAITSTIENVNGEKYANCVLPLPPLSEQSAIVRFLAHASRQIQRYISAKRKLIALLEEQKKTIIQQAVTGQIDVRTGQSYGAYRPAGLMGVSEIPKHWEQCRLRNVVSVVTTGSRGWSSYAADTGPLFIRVANLNRGSIQLRFDDVVRLDLPNTTEAARSRIRAGDLLVSVTAYIGSVGVAADGLEEAYVSQHVARCQPRPGQSGRWLAYGLLSELGQSHGQLSLYGGTKDGLSLDDVKNFPILVPSAREQEEIVRWIDDKLASVAKVKGSAQREIVVMGEYRARLVADVVTGKLDVRQAAGTLPVTHTSDDPRGTHREDE